MSSERPPMKMPAPAALLLRDLFRQKGMAERMENYRIWRIWDQAVGPQIAARARPLRLREDVLEVRVDHPVWMQQLQLMKPAILSRLAQSLGREAIRDIYLRRGRVEPLPPPPPPPLALPPLDTQERARAEAAVQSVSDPELQRHLLALFTRQMQLEKARKETLQGA